MLPQPVAAVVPTEELAAQLPGCAEAMPEAATSVTSEARRDMVPDGGLTKMETDGNGTPGGAIVKTTDSGSQGIFSLFFLHFCCIFVSLFLKNGILVPFFEHLFPKPTPCCLPAGVFEQFSKR